MRRRSTSSMSSGCSASRPRAGIDRAGHGLRRRAGRRYHAKSMANRSHLYTCDEVPGAESFYARGLSEYNWDIPPVHKLMMANAPRVVRSAIWDHDIGILAERAGAFARVLGLFHQLGAGPLAARDPFERELAQMRSFLAEAPPTRYVLLEAGEIFDIQGGELVDHAHALVAEITELAARTERAIAGGDEAWLATLRADWQERARPGWW